MNYTVVIQPEAEREVREICRYLDQEAPHHTEQWLDRYANALLSLAHMPQRCARAPESARFPHELRQILFDSYRMVFTIAGSKVRILHVRHQARAPL